MLSGETRLYSARPALLSGSCKRESAEAHAELISTALEGARKAPALAGVRILCVASDGEARRGAALDILTAQKVLQPDSPIYALLSSLLLMDLHVGEDDLTTDKDNKHIAFKRIRNTLLRKLGTLICDVYLVPPVFRQHLRDSGSSQEHINSAMNPHDKQDVELAFRLLQDLWSLEAVPTDKNSDVYVQQRNALMLLGDLCRHLVLPYVCVDLSLFEQLVHLSSAAHMVLALYVWNNAKHSFIPTELYKDIMLMIKNAFFCVAKVKIEDPSANFFLILLGTDRLETLFGIMRTMVGSDATMDMLQIGLRAASTVDIANIFAKHPD